MTRCGLCFAFLLLPSLSSHLSAQPTRKVSFTFRDRAELEKLEATGAFEILEVHGRRAVALQNPAGAEDGTLAGGTPAGLTVLSADVDEELAEFRARASEGLYHSVAETEAELAELAQQYPGLARRESIGKTFEGRDIWALRITGAADPAAVPRVLIFGLVHAREWISAELPFHVIRRLLAGHATDPRIRAVVDGRVIWVIPVTNPDGLHYSQTAYKMWRKNRSRRSSSSVGVDVNRNFEVGWGQGSSGSPGSDVYRGPHASSEEETRALLALMQRERFNVSLSLHSYSELVLYPWGHTDADPPGKETLAGHGKAMGQANGYRPGSVAQILYTAGGATDDTFFARHGCWSWTFELGRQFVPPEDKIESICRKNWPAVLHLLEAASGLAATPPPIGPAAPVEQRLAAVEAAARAPEGGAGAGPGDTAAELIAGLVELLPADPALAAEVRRRAADPARRALYRPLLSVQ
jgi:carboxypeptidase T